MLQAGSVKNKYCRNRNRTTITSANLSKAISNHTHIPILNSKSPIWIQDNYGTGGSLELFGKKMRVKLNYLDENVLKEVVRVAEESYC